MGAVDPPRDLHNRPDHHHPCRHEFQDEFQDHHPGCVPELRIPVDGLKPRQMIDLNPAPKVREYRLAQEKRDRRHNEELSMAWALMEAAEKAANSSSDRS